MSHDDKSTIAETEHFIIWRSAEGEESLYHIEFGGVTLHVTDEEWEEIVMLFKSVPA